MKKYVVISHGRTASNSLCNHLRNSLDKLGIPQTVHNLETPMIWLDTVPDAIEWNAIVLTRQDQLAQVLSFYTILKSLTIHKTSLENQNVQLEPFIVEREYFFAFAYSILAFEKKVFDFNNWERFKSYQHFEYEEMTKDWTEFGKTLGYDDWTTESKLHETGWGNVWDKVINKSEVLAYVAEIQLTTKFRYQSEKYKV